ncbi:DUF3788 family protein [Dysgonomonas sp. 25]|uniref:DUF3788 family protein n=1 Tax=Dysgonomonas sp. 25 TaxID=2302933 RepID=UPI0013D0F1AA|nr:DUF3788 family protein [Dysgonomonas sp. 25]NDV67616.1 DUF3788 family protein [Dysgonomonas sp. 25]
MEKQLLLRNPDLYPDEKVLGDVLGDVYPVLFKLTEMMESPDYGLTINWNFYKDGKAWLGKVAGKKKTVFWLSIWEGHFKLSFYFTPKNWMGVMDLDIDPAIKEDFERIDKTTRLIALIIAVDSREQLNDILQVIKYKLSLK